MAKRGPVLVVDIGGTKMAGGVCDPDGTLLTWESVPTPAGADAQVLWETLESLLAAVLHRAGGPDLAGVGSGCGGPMRWPDGLVSPLNIPGWRDFPLRPALAERFGRDGVPVRLHNDAICMTVGEHWRGAGRGTTSMLGMVVSTGVGGGLVADGRLVNGASGNAGHIGHVIVDAENGPLCTCGGRGCLEAIARGPGLAAWAQSQGWRAGEADVTGKELAEDAALGHPVAQAALGRAGRALGIAIASATSLCDLEVVAVGGGLSQAGELLFTPLRAALAEYARLEFTHKVRVAPAVLGQTAGLVGAGALVLRGERYWAGD